MNMRKIWLVGGLFLSLFLVACGGPSGSPNGPSLAISTTSPLSSGTVGAAYSLAFAATGGTAPYSWSSSGTLPAGLSLSSAGVLSGTPTTAASSSFTITVTDSEASPKTASLAATLVINAQLAITTTSPLPSGTVGSAYSLPFAATGGNGIYTWSVSAGTLPAGLALSSAGVLSGTPTTAGSSSFTVKVNDSETTPQTATLAATLVINPATLAIATTTPLTPGAVGSVYSLTFAATGGITPYAWSISAGTLPLGLALSAAGVLSGTPTVVGSSTFTVSVTDTETTPQTAILAATLVINPPPTLTITTTSLPSVQVNAAYPSTTFAATGGVPPYAWSVDPAAPALPAGLAFSAAGVLSGTPTTVDNVNSGFIVTDSVGDIAEARLNLTISAIPDGTYAFLFNGTAPQGAATPPVQSGVAINGEFTIQAGAVTAGFYDENTNTGTAPVVEQPITGGTITSGANGLGTLVLNSALGNLTLALATPVSAGVGSDTAIRIIGFGDTNGTGIRGSGVVKPSTPESAAVQGNFAFLISGANSALDQEALIGSFQTDGNGNVINGKAYANQTGGVFINWTTLSGIYTIDANGRGEVTIGLGYANFPPSNGAAPFHFSFYEVSPGEWFMITLDPVTANAPLAAGSVLQQTGAPFSTASLLPSTSVVESNGIAQPAGGTTPDITLGLASSDGNGNVTYTYDEYAGTLSAGQTLGPINYVVDPSTGQATSSSGAPDPVLFLVNSSTSLILYPGISASNGLVEAQTNSSFTNASFSGNYLGGSLPLDTPSVLNEAGLVSADGNGNVTLTTNRSSSAGLVTGQVVTGTYVVDGTGRVVVTAADGLTRIFRIVSPTKVILLSGDTGGYLGSFQQ